MLKVAVIGLGAISQTHIEAIYRMDNARLAAVCDIDSSKQALVPGVPFYTDVDAMCREIRPDCVHICLPHDLHVPMAQKLAGLGVHVFLEKPAGLNARDAGQLLQIQQAGRVKLGVCLQHRYDRAVACAREVIASGRFGALQGMRAMVAWDRREGYYTRDPWRGKLDQAGGGVMLSQAIHILDLMLYLGGEPEWVKGLAGNLLLEDIEVEDTASGCIHFCSGINGVFYTTVTHCRNDSVELELVFEKKVLLLAHEKLYVLEEDGPGEVLAENDQLCLGKNYYGSGHYRAIRSFYSAVSEDTDAYIPVSEGIRSVRLIDAVMESARSGVRVAV